MDDVFPRTQHEVPVLPPEQVILGIAPTTTKLLDEWVAAAQADGNYPLHVSSLEHWDNIGLEVWARIIFDIRDRLPVEYKSIAALGRLYEIPSPEWVARKRAGIRERWLAPPGPKPL